jgi:phosphoglycerate dehydrogenase-like enzyme
MGGGPAKEHLLIALPLPEPTNLISSLRKQHPHLDITYHHASRDPKDSPPKSLFAKTTILVTFATLPADPKTDAPNLTWLHLFSAGSNHIQSHPLYTSTSITITTSSGVHGPTIAEWAVLTRLVESRKYNHLLAQQRAHAWSTHDPALGGVRDQVGGTLGILGYGSIGRQIARVAKGLGMKVLAYTASPKDSPESKRDGGFVVPGTGDVEGSVPEEWFSGLEKGDLHGFLGQGLDWLVVCVPLTEKTRGFLGKEEFGVLRDGLGKKVEAEGGVVGGGAEGRKTFVTNIARGPIIDQEALIEALKDGTLQGAALDVTDPEPLPADSELWDLDNMVVTPHISGNGVAYEDRAFQVLGVNLERREKGEQLINVVKRERGY